MTTIKGLIEEFVKITIKNKRQESRRYVWNFALDMKYDHYKYIRTCIVPVLSLGTLTLINVCNKHSVAVQSPYPGISDQIHIKESR